jgi:hypothetical protein
VECTCFEKPTHNVIGRQCTSTHCLVHESGGIWWWFPFLHGSLIANYICSNFVMFETNVNTIFHITSKFIIHGLFGQIFATWQQNKNSLRDSYKSFFGENSAKSHQILRFFFFLKYQYFDNRFHHVAKIEQDSLKNSTFPLWPLANFCWFPLWRFHPNI